MPRPYFPTQNPNQFSQVPLLGQTSMALQPNVLPCIFNPNSAAPELQVGHVVKLVSVSANQIVVDLAAAGDIPFGVVGYNLKRNTYLPGDAVGIASGLSVMYLQASAALEAGDPITFNNTNITVSKAGAGVSPLGYVLIKCETANSLALVMITAPLGSLYAVPAPAPEPSDGN